VAGAVCTTLVASGAPGGSLAGPASAAVLSAYGTRLASHATGDVDISIWAGYQGVEGTELSRLISEYDKEHSGTVVTSLYVNNDDTLQKVLVAVRGGSPPDIAYLYGSWAPNVAEIKQVVKLNNVVSRKGVDWDDFGVGERDVATVGKEVIGIPALVDNLAVVYNRSLFKAANLAPPSPTWTWDDFVADAAKLTVPSKKQYGTAYITSATEDTVWHWEPLLWEAGGKLLNADNTKAAFDSKAGLLSLSTLRQMAVVDHSMYLDPTGSEYANLFNSGKIGMLVTGPWDLASFPSVSYGVQVMPSFPGTDGGHQTISGPDNWVIFNNGPAHVKAAEDFLLWLTAPAQVRAWSLATGDLSTRQSVTSAEGFAAEMNSRLPGVATFLENLSNVKQARPQIPTYPKISTVLGYMIVSVLLGKSTPAAALRSAAQQVNQALANPYS
jgi:multiple sugar transport system substrate-binding protein